MKYLFSIIIFLSLFINCFAADNNRNLLDAIRSGSFGKIDSLLGNGADINHKDLSGKTALMFAVQNSTSDIISYLIKNGADVNARNFNNVSSLHYAARSKNIEIVKILLDNNAKTNIKDFSGFTPLMRAVSNKNFEAVSLLLEKGGDYNIKNNNGANVFDLALANNDTKTFSILLEEIFLTKSLTNDLTKKTKQVANNEFIKIFRKKINDYTELKEKRILSFNNEDLDIDDLKIKNLDDFPCFEKKLNDNNESECFTFRDEILRKEELKLAKAEAERLKLLEQQSLKLAEAKEKVRLLSLSHKFHIKFNSSTPIIKNNEFYVNMINEFSVVTKNLKSDNILISFVSGKPWYKTENSSSPLNILKPNLVQKYYDKEIDNKAVFSRNESLIKRLESKRRSNKKYVINFNQVKNQEKDESKNITIDDLNKTKTNKIFEPNSSSKIHQENSLEFNPVKFDKNKIEAKVGNNLVENLSVNKSPENEIKYSLKGFYIQTGVFSNLQNANKLKKVLFEIEDEVIVFPKKINGKMVNIVFIGPFKSKERAVSFQNSTQLKKVIAGSTFIKEF